ncbi:MAG: hypothetical protein AAGE98_20050, partial [Actinomycetota bacterium]
MVDEGVVRSGLSSIPNGDVGGAHPPALLGDREREYAPRDWMANLKAHPEFRFVLKESTDESLEARAV